MSAQRGFIITGDETFQNQALKALAKPDLALIQSLGHKLRGSAGSYGFTELTEIGTELEDYAKVSNKILIEKAIGNYQLYLKRLKISYRKT